MQRVVTEAVQLVQLSFVHTLLPVDIEHAFRDDRHLVYLVGIESDNTQTHEVGDIIDALILRTFPFEFSSQRLFGFHPVFKSRYVDTLFTKCATQEVVSLLGYLLERGQQFTILLHQHFAVRVECYLIHNSLVFCRKSNNIIENRQIFPAFLAILSNNL